MAFKSALMILAALTLATTAKATASTTTTTTTTTLAATTTTTTVATTTTTTVATTTGPTTTTTTGPTTTTTTGPTTTAGATTTVAPATTANIPNTTTTPLPASTELTAPVLAGSTTLQVADTDGFTAGMEVVIGVGTPTQEFNTIKAIGTIDLQTPLMNNHPAGTTVTEKKPDETTTTTLAPNPCVPTTTTVGAPCVPEVITTTHGPCDTGPVITTTAEAKKKEPFAWWPWSKDYDAKQGAVAVGNGASLSMIIGWSFAGFVAVAAAMIAIRRQSENRRSGTLSRVMRAESSDLQYGMLQGTYRDIEAPLE